MASTSDFDEFAYQLECEAAEAAAKQKAAEEQAQKVILADEAVASLSGTQPTSYVDPQDGTVYEWNDDLKGMFPKVSDEVDLLFKAQYGNADQNQGVPANDEDAESCSSRSKTTVPNSSASEEPPAKRKKSEKPPVDWFEVDDTHNHNVYADNLPVDITQDEFSELMSKAGIIMKDPRNGRLKMKLYAHPDGSLKGDGLCCYLKIESVELALKVLDGVELRGHTLHVQRAKFEKKGEFDVMKQRLRRLKPSDKKKLKKQEDKLLAWQPDRLPGQRANCERTAVIKGMFDPLEFKAEPALLLDYQNDLREECAQFGTVKKAVIYDRHPDGVAVVMFDTPEEADKCIARMNGRWFNQKQLAAETWDGKTKYKVEETAQEAAERIEHWEKVLDNEDLSTATSTSPRLAAIINPEFASVEHIKQLEIPHNHQHPAFHDEEVRDAAAAENDAVSSNGVHVVDAVELATSDSATV